mgnify:CR=1 FL=1
MSLAFLTSTAAFVLPRPTVNAELEGRARRYLSLGNAVKQQLGPTSAEDLERELADDFEFVAPLVGPLGRDAIIAATTGLDLSVGLPDFDARYHDFRADPDDPFRVWCTMRVTATHTGVLSFGGLKAEPRSPPVVVESPPEAVSLRFDSESGKLRELTTGYPLDRRVGSTGGLGGLFGILEGVGCPLPTPLTRPAGYLLSPLLRPLGLALPTASEDVARPRPTASEAERLDDDRCASHLQPINGLVALATCSRPIPGPRRDNRRLVPGPKCIQAQPRPQVYRDPRGSARSCCRFTLG